MVTDITGAVLAGGRSSRFGANKAFAKIGGKNMIERVLEIMEGIFRETVIVTNNPEEYRSLGFKILKDIESHRGPLGGIITALTYAEAVFVCACDMPFITREAVLKVVSAAKGDSIAVAGSYDRIEPLFAVYKRPVMGHLKSMLQSGTASPSGAVRKAANVAYVDIGKKIVSSINRVEDIHASSML